MIKEIITALGNVSADESVKVVVIKAAGKHYVLFVYILVKDSP